MRPAKWSLANRILVAALVLGGACHAGGAGNAAPATGSAPPRVANLHAFARLYGVLRWFHPSDAAAELD